MVTLLRQMQSCTDITLLTFLDTSNVDILQKAKSPLLTAISVYFTQSLTFL